MQGCGKQSKKSGHGIHRQCIHHVQLKSSIPKHSFLIINQYLLSKNCFSADERLKMFTCLLDVTYNQWLYKSRCQ